MHSADQTNGVSLAESCEADYRRHFFDISSELLSAGTPDGVIRLANPAFLRTLGWTIGELQARPWIELVHPDERAGVMAEVGTAVAEGRAAAGENRVATKSGEYRWLSWRFPPTTSDGWIFCSARDVTDEREWLQERRLLAKVVERTDNAVLLTDPDWRVEWVNAGFERLTGYTLDEIRGKRPGDLLWGPETDPRAKAVVEEGVRTREGFDVEILKYRKDGSTYWVRIEARPLERNGVFSGFMALELDITARREAESRLRRYAALLDHAGRIARMGAWELMLGSQKPVWSEEVYRIHEVAPEYQPTLETALDFYPPEARERLTAAIAHSVETGESWDLELPFVTGKGNRRWVRALGEPEMVNGQCVRLTGVFKDTTEARESQLALERLIEELEKARERAEEAHRAKSDLLAVMSHEIRTPLNGVLGMLELLADAEIASEHRELVLVARQSAHTLGTLLNDLLDLSKAEAGRLELEHIVFDPAVLAGEVRDLFAPAAQEKGIALMTQANLNPGLHYRGDPGRLRQVMMNLVGNAVKFTELGSVTLEVHQAESPQPGVEIVVRDTGIGIAAETLPRLFEKFIQADSSTTRRFGGTGLGLAITRELVMLMEGTIQVTSEPGVGTTFVCRLPLEPVEVEVATGTELEWSRARERRPGLAGLRVLLVEDNPINQRVAKGLLRREECVVEVAPDGETAVAKAETGTYDLILMDGQMPGMDGYEATRAIRALGGPAAETPIIALTASALRGDRERCYEAGMNDYLTKPVQLKPLLDALERWGRAKATPRRAVNAGSFGG